MIITYSLFSGNSCIAVNQKANGAEALLNVMKELNKLGIGYTYAVRDVDTK